MTSRANTLDKLRLFESFYQQGYQSDVVDQALDKLVALETARTQQELADLQARLDTFEQTYQMSSAVFSVRFRDGALGDAADYFEWSALDDMARSLRQRLQELEAGPA